MTKEERQEAIAQVVRQWQKAPFRKEREPALRAAIEAAVGPVAALDDMTSDDLRRVGIFVYLLKVGDSLYQINVGEDQAVAELVRA